MPAPGFHELHLESSRGPSKYPLAQRMGKLIILPGEDTLQRLCKLRQALRFVPRGLQLARGLSQGIIQIYREVFPRIRN